MESEHQGREAVLLRTLINYNVDEYNRLLARELKIDKKLLCCVVMINYIGLA